MISFFRFPGWFGIPHSLLFLLMMGLISALSSGGAPNLLPEEQEYRNHAPAFVAVTDTVNGGTALPARGELRMPVIFARYATDDAPHPHWSERPDPLRPEAVPQWMRRFIDSPDAASFPDNDAYENISHYFHTASQGRLRLSGDVYHVELPDSLRGVSLGKTSQYILQQLFGRYDDEAGALHTGIAEVPAGIYDSWKPIHTTWLTPQSEQQHLRQADGIMDYALIIYRHRRGQPHPFQSSWNAIASLGNARPYALGDSTLVYSGGRLVSGATALFSDFRRSTDFIYHEIAHHLLGAAHPYIGGSGIHPAYWGLFSSYLANQSINAWEREELGWGSMQRLEFPVAAAGESDDAPSNPITLQLGDFMTTGDAAAFSIPNVAEEREQLIIFEHRARKHQASGGGSSYDAASLNEADKGLFLYTLRPPYGHREQNIMSFPADGHYGWEVSEWNEACGEENFQPVLRKAEPHPRGISYRDIFVISPEHSPVSNPSDSLYSLFVSYDAPQRCHTYTRGEYHHTAFGPESLSGKRWFSAFTNPGSLLDDGRYSGISAYVHGSEDGNMRVSFSEHPFLPGLDTPLEINQDVFFYVVPGAVESSVITIPEGVTLRLGPAARLFLEADLRLDIRGRLISPAGREIRGQHGRRSLQAYESLSVHQLPALPAYPRRASF